MKNAIKIFSYVFVLIGGTLVFAYWSLNSFDQVFSSIDSAQQSSLANVISINNIPESNSIATTTQEDQEIETPNTITPDINNFEFTFPSKPTDFYKGCEYTISWQDLGIDSVNMTLIDAGNRKAIGPTVSGVPRSLSGKSLQSFDWKVRNIWSGKYYIEASSINGNEIQKRSAVITLVDIPIDITPENIDDFCQKQAL